MDEKQTTKEKNSNVLENMQAAVCPIRNISILRMR